MIRWVLVALLAVALAYAAVVTRYEYSRGVPIFRVDRWTGRVQSWEQECVRRENPFLVQSPKCLEWGQPGWR